METLMKDLALAQGSQKQKGAETILEAVGCDIDEAARNLSYFQTADVATLSIGGQTITPGASFQINIRDQGVLLFLDRTALVFDVVLSAAANADGAGIFKNAMALIQPLQIQLGSQSWGIGNGHKYAQYYLSRRSAKRSKIQDRGLYVVDDSIPCPGSAVADGGTVTYTHTLGIKFNAQSDIVQFCQKTSENLRTIKCVIPLRDLMLGLIDVPDDVVYLGQGQNMLINAKFNSAQDSLAPTVAIPTAYSVQNAYLMKVYYELNHEQESRILKSQINLPFQSIISQPRPFGTSVNATFNFPRGEKLKKLYFGIFPNAADASLLNGGQNTPALFFDGTTGPQWRSPNNFFPMAPFTYMQISLNGYQVALNQYLQQSLAYGDCFDDVEHKYVSAWRKVTQHCHCIDLSRFGEEDWYGSGQQSENVLQLEVQNQAGIPLPYFGLALPDDLAAAGFTFHAFAVTQRTGELKHGIYTSSH